jgi:hypothetical protein
MEKTQLTESTGSAEKAGRGAHGCVRIEGHSQAEPRYTKLERGTAL